MTSPKRHHRNEGLIKALSKGPCRSRQYDFLAISLAKNDQFGKVKLRMRSDSLLHVLEDLSIVGTWKEYLADSRAAVGSVQLEMTNMLWLHATENARRLTGQQHLRIGAFGELR